MDLSNTNKRRMFCSLVILGFIMCCLIIRLLWIQIISVHQFSAHSINLVEEAVSQRKQEVILHTGRGDILDRNGTPLTGTPVKGVAVFPLVRGVTNQDKLEQLANILRINHQKFIELVDGVKEPTFIRGENGRILALSDEEARQVEELALPGIIPLPITERYQNDGLAAHLIGYISQNPELIEKEYADELRNGEISRHSLIGASGLERSFQRFLQGVGPTSVSYFVDGRGNPLNGLKARLIEQENQFYPLSVVTTVDHDLQQKVEQWMGQAGIKQGSVTILDANTREVLAMASQPEFNPTKIDPNQSDWVNRAIKQISPGSVFKTVIAAAVLEEGLVKPDDHFECNGSYGKYGFSCWKEGGHGSITFAEAFAESCNITFAKAALKLPPGKIEEYAAKLGVTQRVGWEESPFFKMDTFRQFSGEDAGQIFSPKTQKKDEGIIIQTAIGQRDVQITPLQAANMVASIVGGGERKEVRVVGDIRYKTGSVFYSFEDKELPGEGIKPYTAYQLRKMMELVVTDGTAKALAEADWQIAGKTGTAQIDSKGAGKNNQWFVGYAPSESPKYVIAIVAEQENLSGSNRVIPLFKRIVNELAALEEQN
ncbi:peptidoglycan D,D-transpeptidase FtsI family protein [Ammoniphilus resinae]|nr:penicillin-binding protein 2 [Ammoniphilus resinae]